MSVRTPDRRMVLDAALAGLSATLRVGMPGQIQKFDASKQLADVKPLCPNVFVDEQGNTIVESIPVIANVPVQFVGGGGFALTHPIAQNDPCWLAFGDRSIDPWLDNGQEADPHDLRKHDLTDAVAWVGLRHKQAVLSEFDTARIVIGKQGGNKIALKANEVHLGVTHNQDATEAAILGTTFKTDLNSLLDAMSTALQNCMTYLTAAQASLQTAATANMTPIYGGALANPGFQSVALQLGAAGIAGQLANVIQAITQFKAQDQNHKSTIVKVK